MPRHGVSIEQIAQRRILKARERALAVAVFELGLGHQQRGHGARGRVASPRFTRREVNQALRLRLIEDRAAGDEILMGGKTAAALRLEHMIGQHELLGHVPVRRDLRRIDVLVRARSGLAGTLLAPALQVEAVHLAAVVVFQKSGVRVTEITRIGKVDLLERDLGAVFERAERRSVRAGEGREEVVEGAVLLNDDDHVRDRRRAGRTPGDSPGRRRLPRKALGIAARTGCRRERGGDRERAARAYEEVARLHRARNPYLSASTRACAG